MNFKHRYRSISAYEYFNKIAKKIFRGLKHLQGKKMVVVGILLNTDSKKVFKKMYNIFESIQIHLFIPAFKHRKKFIDSH